jgi:hypothetical protein
MQAGNIDGMSTHSKIDSESYDKRDSPNYVLIWVLKPRSLLGCNSPKYVLRRVQYWNRVNISVVTVGIETSIIAEMLKKERINRAGITPWEDISYKKLIDKEVSAVYVISNDKIFIKWKYNKSLISETDFMKKLEKIVKM